MALPNIDGRRSEKCFQLANYDQSVFPYFFEATPL